jgi:hypothetical protein
MLSGDILVHARTEQNRTAVVQFGTVFQILFSRIHSLVIHSITEKFNAKV